MEGPLTTDDPRLEMVNRFRRQAEEARARTIRRTRFTLSLVGVLLVGASGVLCLGGLGGAVGLLPRATAAAIGVAVLCAGFGVGALAIAAALRRPEDLRTTGIAGKAKFLEVTGGGLSIEVNNSSMRGNIAQLALRLEIQVEGRAPYEVVVKDFVPSSAVSQLVPGTLFEVFVDRKKPKRVLVDWPDRPLVLR